MKQHEWVIDTSLPLSGISYLSCKHCPVKKRTDNGVTWYFPDGNHFVYDEPACIERADLEPDPSGPCAMGPGH